MSVAHAKTRGRQLANHRLTVADKKEIARGRGGIDIAVVDVERRRTGQEHVDGQAGRGVMAIDRVVAGVLDRDDVVAARDVCAAHERNAVEHDIREYRTRGLVDAVEALGPVIAIEHQ